MFRKAFVKAVFCVKT